MRTSVVIPAYRSANSILRTIDSLLNSNGIDVDIFVIEDGVFDDTRSLIKNFSPNVVIHSFDKNRGAQFARNYGLQFVTTPTVMFLDSDDYLSAEFLALLVSALEKSTAGLAFGPMDVIDEGGKLIKKVCPKIGESRYSIVNRWLSGMPGPHPCGVLWKTDVIRSIGGWNEKMTRNQDGELIIRALSQGHEVVAVDRETSFYVSHKGNRVSNTKTLYSFECQNVILDVIRDWEARDMNVNFDAALSEFCLNVAVQALQYDLREIGKAWHDKSLKFGRGNRSTVNINAKQRLKHFVISSIGLQNFLLLKKFQSKLL